MASTPSLTNDLLADVAGFVAEDVAAALINGNIRIDSLTKAQNGNILTVSYPIRPADTEVITSLALLSADGQVLSQATVYVPVVENIMLKHNIKVEEGGKING